MAAQLHRGFEVARTLPAGNKHEWAWVARTYLFDKLILREIQEGAKLVVNLAAGPDARAYPMDLPSRLQWVAVDLRETISYKKAALSVKSQAVTWNRLPSICRTSKRVAAFSLTLIAEPIKPSS